MSSTETATLPVAYEVRSGTGRTIERHLSYDDAVEGEIAAIVNGWHAYVVWVELVPGQGWVAQED